jgi:hypothetical protein
MFPAVRHSELALKPGPALPKVIARRPLFVIVYRPARPVSHSGCPFEVESIDLAVFSLPMGKSASKQPVLTAQLITFNCMAVNERTPKLLPMKPTSAVPLKWKKSFRRCVLLAGGQSD